MSDAVLSIIGYVVGGLYLAASVLGMVLLFLFVEDEIRVEVPGVFVQMLIGGLFILMASAL